MKTYQKMTLKNIINFANPKSFVASIIPSIFGILMLIKSGYSISLLRSLGLVLSCVFLQSSVNTINDYSDFINGVDSKEDNLKESDNIMFYNCIRPENVRNLGLFFLTIGIVFGLLTLESINYKSIIIGIIGVITVLNYSMGPFPISYLPVGEVFSGIVMGGLIPIGVFSVISEKIDFTIMGYAMPFIIGISLIMMSNNSSDIEKDKKANRNTLAVVMGRKNIRILYKILIIVWFISQSYLVLYFGGYKALIIDLIIFFLKRKFIFRIFTASLLPQDRVRQMMDIGLTNILLNFSYLVIIVIILIGE